MRLLWEAHSHTTLCNHAHGTVEEYAEAALAKNLAGIHITCHTPLPAGFSPQVRMRLDQMNEYLEMIQSVREKFAGRLEIGTGLECDYLPELEPWIAEMRERRLWSHFLGSVHPQTPEFKKSYSQGGVTENITRYFQLVAKSAESGFFDTLGHPDLIKNEYPDAWKVEEVMKVVCNALDRIAKTGVAMEMNTSGWNKAIQEVNPGPVILKEMAKRNIPVVLGADAHRPTRVGDRFLDGLMILEEAGYREVGLQEVGKRRMISIAEARASLI
ncbi:MAG: histidinol-phosphatase [Verrucomicrobiota bacterium]